MNKCGAVKGFLAVGLAVCISLFAAGTAKAQNGLGQAAGYNLYVLGNYSASGTDTEGAVAVGGNFNFTAYTVNSALTNGNLGLVVGGTATGSGGTINGNIDATTLSYSDPTVNGGINANSVSLSSYGTVSGNVTYFTSDNNGTTTVSGNVSKGAGPFTLPINFATTNTLLKNNSSQWGAAASTGTTVDAYNTITLTGTSNTLNIFNVTQAQIDSTNNVVINAPAGSTVVVNIAGTNDTWGGGITLNGVSESDVIYNFYQASNLTISGIAVDGSVMAPNAAINFVSGTMNGTVIAGSLSGNGQINFANSISNNDLFAGNLSLLLVPEPAQATTLALGVFFLAGLLLYKRNKRQSTNV